MIHIWLPNPQAPLRVWQDTTQTWQTADNWQEVATLINLQHAKAKDKVACLYFPSLSVLKIQTELTPSQLKALGDTGKRYLFEDISITAVDDLIVNTQPNSEAPALYALHQADQSQWQHSASLVGVTLGALLPDFVLLPNLAQSATAPSQGTVTYYQDNDTALLQLPHEQGSAVSHLPITLHKSTNIDYVYLTGQIDQALTNQLDTLSHISYQLSDAMPQPVANPTRHWLNFTIRQSTTKFSPYLKTILMVAGFALLLSMVVDGLRWYHYQKATGQAKTLLKQQYESWFPNEKFNTRLNIQRLMADKLVNNQPSNTNILSVLASVQPVLQQYQITAKQLNYQNNTVQLQLVAKDNATLTQAVSQLTNQGINAKLGSVTGNALGNAIANNPVSPTNPNEPSPNTPTGMNSNAPNSPTGAMAMVEIQL
ncbi:MULTISPECIES: type II secretion system protein GspL [unclassified Moraxella]|uniref:type II secretion system protein GspL n=1 Tax=unclassified Moraxella TaxID=2685852 RepID=UPI003AF542C4